MDRDDNMVAVYEADEARSARYSITELDRAHDTPLYDDEVDAALSRRRGRGVW